MNPCERCIQVSQALYSKVQDSIQPTNKLRLGSLCTGYGGLDMAVEAYFDAETIWCAEFDKYASQVIEKRFAIPNYGNIKKINWGTLPAIDILTAGYPCQPFSHAGQRKGTHDERHLFPYIKEAISTLRPRLIVLENVKGHLSLGFKEVLKDLAEIGYDARWQIVRASDAGAPHQRARLYIVAYPTSIGFPYWHSSGSQKAQSCIENNGCSTNSNSNSCEESRRDDSRLQGTPSEIINRPNRHEYGFSIEMDRQEVPDTLDQDGKLNPVFVEYMMGLPKGWITDLDLLRSQKLKMLGNGVVPQQAYLALQLLCDDYHSHIVRQ